MNTNVIFLKPGSYLFHENDQGSCFYILKSGRLEVIKNQQVLTEINDEGTVFGEMSFFNNGIRTSGIRAKTGTTVLRVDASLDRVIEKYPQVTKKIIAQLSSRIKQMDEKLVVFKSSLEDLNKKFLNSKEVLSEHIVSLIEYLKELKRNGAGKSYLAYTTAYLFTLLLKADESKLILQYLKETISLTKSENLQDLESRVNLLYAKWLIKNSNLNEAIEYYRNSCLNLQVNISDISDENFAESSKITFLHKMTYVDILSETQRKDYALKILLLLNKQKNNTYQKAVIYFRLYKLSGKPQDRFLALDNLRKLYKETGFEYYRNKISKLKAK